MPDPDLASNLYPDLVGERCLQVLLERLRNEITRLTAVKALADIARSPLPLPLDAALQPALPDLTSFLRKANRQLRQASLSALQVRQTGLLNVCHQTRYVSSVRPVVMMSIC